MDHEELKTMMPKEETEIKKVNQTLTIQAAERGLVIQSLSSQLSEIKNNKSWKVKLFFQRLIAIVSLLNNHRSKILRFLFTWVVDPVKQIRRKIILNNDINLIKTSTLFDEMYYLANNPDIVNTIVAPIQHYLFFGGFEGRDPGPKFSSKWYLDTYSDVRSANINPLIHYLKYGKKDSRHPKPEAGLENKPLSEQHWGIMVTLHTLFIAHLIAERLNYHGCQVSITTNSPSDFTLDYYVVICPQMFKTLPPREKCIFVQMEQSVSSRWFTKGYFKTLNQSLAILEYSNANIEFLAKKKIAYPLVYHLPIGAIRNYVSQNEKTEKIYDVLFYGALTPRRQKLLEVLGLHFNVNIVTDKFDQDMLNIIRQSKVIINLHYYENAILEMPRIQECLSLGVPVISETTQDQGIYPELIGAVRFFEQGSIPAMLQAVKEGLESPVSSDSITFSVDLSANRFGFMFDRFLVGKSFLPISHIKEMPLPNITTQVVLSLPETITRRRKFQLISPDNFVLFDGIRRTPGWVGAGLSYAALAQKALEMNINRLTIMEDDVLLPKDFQNKMEIIHEYLDDNEGKWDIFAGIVADLHQDVKVLKVEVFKGITFVTINKMISMVCNIYNQKALNILASWNPYNTNIKTNSSYQYNTIDKHLENQDDLNIILTLPFLVGHRQEENSSIWGIQNTQFSNKITSSQQRLENKVKAYELEQNLK